MDDYWYPEGAGINTLCTQELVDELLQRHKVTDGFVFCSDESLNQLWTAIHNQLTGKKGTY